MATKYIAIPETMYTSLLQMQKNNQIGIDLAKTELEKAKKSRTKNLSAKNIMYNQELRRYLKTKKEEDEKPIKVELSNGIKGIVKKSTPANLTGGRNRILSLSSQNTFDHESDEYVDADEELFDDTEVKQDEDATPAPGRSDTRYERLVEIIRQNPAKFGVRRNKILNTKNMVTVTDFKHALKHYLQPYDYAYSPGTPEGGKLLISRLQKDPETKAILNERDIKVTPTSTRQRRKKQVGGGIINTNKILNNAIIKFKPQLWTKN